MRLGFGLMCKAPRPGLCKTRLAAALGAEAATGLARAFLQDSAALLRAVADGLHAPCIAFHTPADAGPELAALLPGWVLRPQPEGDLGARMGAALDRLFALGAEGAVLTGADAPTLPRALLDLLGSALARGADAALIPARDGGYCALAAPRPIPALLAGMPWSTPAVLDATRSAAEAAGLRLAVLAPWHDVDAAEDLDLLRLTLRGLAPPGLSPLPPWPAHATRRALGSVPN
ncbi:MAG: TIGR04282 family arsenosugar biosynthesis glycosyltransferase [Roseococcus sp.]